MSRGSDRPPSPRGRPLPPVEASTIEPISPLPAPIDIHVPQGSYGAAPHVPLKPYVPPLPRAMRDSAPPLRIVTEDPLAFLAAQTKERVQPAPEAAPTPGLRRFRPADGAEPVTHPAARRPSVPPPGYR